MRAAHGRESTEDPHCRTTDSQWQRDRFLNPQEASLYLGGLNHRTVTVGAREGYLPAYPIGEGKRRLWRFREEDLAEWMEGRRQAGCARR